MAILVEQFELIKGAQGNHVRRDLVRAVVEPLDFDPTDFLVTEDTGVRNAVVVEVGASGEALGDQESEESKHSQEGKPRDGAFGVLGGEPERRAKDKCQDNDDQSHTHVRFVGVEHGSEHRNSLSL